MDVKTIPVPEGVRNERADRFLGRFFPQLPETAIRNAFTRRDVRLDGKRISRDARVSAGQTVTIYYLEKQLLPPLEVVYEDPDVLLVNKRAGISIEKDERDGMTLTELCEVHVGTCQSDAPAPRPCHRLDNQTSGLCLFAKNENALTILQDVFRRRSLDKRYECLVRGFPKPPSALCKAYLLKDSLHARVTVQDHPIPNSRLIITEYCTLQAGPVSRLQVHLVTGRTHQIRAHLAALGHPILGDDLYGDHDFNHAQKARTLKLCAVSLRLNTGGRLPALDGVFFHIRAPF